MKYILPYLFLASFLTGNSLAETKSVPAKQKSEINQILPKGFVSNTKRTYPESKLPLEIRCEKDGSSMAFVPAGECYIGSENGDEDEKPWHNKYTNSFWIDKYETTFTQYDKFCEATQRKKPVDNEWGRGNKPVINVSWYDAVEYAKWAGKRLPTEAEWEKAAAGDGGNKYPWGDELSNEDKVPKANYDGYEFSREHHAAGEEDGYKYTAPVGSYPEAISPYGCFDMAGNVWEWVDDVYAPYEEKEEVENPKVPEKGDLRVMRGGSWANSAYSMRCANRNPHGPKYGNCNLGFRCAVSPPQSVIEGELAKKRAEEELNKTSELEEEVAEVQGEETETAQYKSNISGERGNLNLIMGDEYLGQKNYDITFAFEKDAPEEIGLENIIEIRNDGRKEAKIGQDTKRKTEFSCSLVSYLRNCNNNGRNFSQSLDLKANEYSSVRSSLLKEANLAGTLEELGEAAGYNFATGQPVDSRLLEGAVMNYVIKTVEDMVTVYSIGSNTSADRTMSEIMKTLAGAWLSNKRNSDDLEGEFIRDLRASFLVQSIYGEKYLRETKELIEQNSYFRGPTNYKEIEYFYSKFKDGWTKGGVLKGWKKLEDENFDRQVGRGIGKALAGKYVTNEIRQGVAVLNFFDSVSKAVESEESRIKRRSDELKKLLEDENIRQILNVIRIEMQESETFFDNFEKYR